MEETVEEFDSGDNQQLEGTGRRYNTDKAINHHFIYTGEFTYHGKKRTKIPRVRCKYCSREFLYKKIRVLMHLRELHNIDVTSKSFGTATPTSTDLFVGQYNDPVQTYFEKTGIFVTHGDKAKLEKIKCRFCNEVFVWHRKRNIRHLENSHGYRLETDTFNPDRVKKSVAAEGFNPRKKKETMIRFQVNSMASEDATAVADLVEITNQTPTQIEVATHTITSCAPIVEQTVKMKEVKAKEEKSAMMLERERISKLSDRDLGSHELARFLFPKSRLSDTKSKTIAEYIKILKNLSPYLPLSPEELKLAVKELVDYFAFTPPYDRHNLQSATSHPLAAINWWKTSCARSHLKKVAVALLSIPSLTPYLDDSSSNDEHSYTGFKGDHSHGLVEVSHDVLGDLIQSTVVQSPDCI